MYVNILSTWIWAYVCLWGTVESITYTRVVLLSLSMLKRVKGGDASQGCKVCYCSNGPWAYRPESGGENPVVSKKLRVYPAIKSPPKNMKKKLWYVICIYIYILCTCTTDLLYRFHGFSPLAVAASNTKTMYESNNTHANQHQKPSHDRMMTGTHTPSR